MGEAAAAVARSIVRHGPLPFDEFCELALYGPGGFFSAGRGAGRRGGDFLTSPEVGPLFGAVVARALDAEWVRLGRPDPFVVVEVGAGRGALARAVVDAAPQCGPAMRYVGVERSARLRAGAEELLELEPASDLFAEVLVDDEGHRQGVAGRGPVVAFHDSVPVGPFVGVVLANELLDNLGVRLFERTGSVADVRWDEVRVALSDPAEGELTELLVPALPSITEEVATLAPAAAVGARVPLQHRAGAWLGTALGLLERGRVVVLDYAATTPELARRPPEEWLRTYSGGVRGEHPLHAPGSQDITCEVAVDQLARVHRPDLDRPQADWLAVHGLDDLVTEGRAVWAERAAIGDLTALRARSRVTEAEALRDPTGLGGFRVLEWVVG